MTRIVLALCAVFPRRAVRRSEVRVLANVPHFGRSSLPRSSSVSIGAQGSRRAHPASDPLTLMGIHVPLRPVLF